MTGPTKNRTEIPVPVFGIIQSFDDARNKVEEEKKKFENYLDQIKKQFKDNTIQYSHTKFQYELEIPKKLV